MSVLSSLRRHPVRYGLCVVAISLAGALTWRISHPAAEAEGKGRPGGPGGGRPVPVSLQKVTRQDMPIYLDGLGTVQAFNNVTIKSRVDGELLDLGFREGQDVKTGDVLARIDPRTYQAQLDQAIAAREKDQAQLEEARLDLQRYQSLGNRVTGQTLDTQKSTVRQLEATVKADLAAVENARAQLSYTTIISPIDGRTGIRNVDKGNIIHASDSAGLVTVTQVQPISVLFTLPQQTLRAIADKGGAGLSVLAVESDNATLVDQGKLELIDNQVDSTTGTIRLKATMPNAQRHLWPGGFVNVRLLLETRNGLVVPSQVVQRGPQGAYAFVVKDDQTVEMRPVTVDHAEGGKSLISSGLNDGETVVSDGMSKLQAGTKIKPIEPPAAAPAKDANAPSAAPAGAPASTEGDAPQGGKHKKHGETKAQ